MSVVYLPSQRLFGSFNSICILQVIRTETGLISPHLEAAHKQMMLMDPVVASRAEAAQRIRDRWASEFDAQKRFR